MNHITAFILFLITRISAEENNVGFDDTILYSLNFVGDTFEPDPTLSHVVVSTSHEEKYKCYLPKIQEPETAAFDKYEGPSPLELVAPLFSQNTCLYRLESYWTYELCHGKFVRQYHEDREGKKVRLQEYILGKWDGDYYRILLDRYKDRSDEEKNIPPPTKKIEGVNLPYLEVTMGNGTLCDLNDNKPRETKIKYVCFVHGKHEIYNIKETSTCEYEIVVLSPLLCLHPRYKPHDTEENRIDCVPIDNAPKKPYNLLKMKAESNKLRRKADVEPIRVEFYPLEDKPKEITPIDTTPIENFLSGRDCLHGGTGWWKYEFCYGKHVEQYHIERDASRTAINLGHFDKKKHVEWLDAHPNKKPKPISKRTQLVHFYSGGSVCDKTGKPRQTEVRLKCLENPTSMNAVSLYLLEPKYCEYILGVESPLICDILNKANEYGLVENYKGNADDDDDDIPTINFKV